MKVRAFLFLLVTIFAGCAVAPGEFARIEIPRVPAWRAPADPAALPLVQVLPEVFTRAPGALVVLSDASFTLVNRAWADELIRWTRAFLEAEHRAPAAGVRWTAESFDCDKFAKAFTLAVEIAASRAGVRAQPLAARLSVTQNEAFGGVPASPGAGHAVVAIATDAGVIVVEPQTGAVIEAERYPNRAHVWRVVIGG